MAIRIHMAAQFLQNQEFKIAKNMLKKKKISSQSYGS